MAPFFFVLGALPNVCLVPCDRQGAVIMWLCKPHTIGDHVLCHETVVVSSTNLGPLPCAPTYNRGMTQHVVFDRFGLAQPHKFSWQAATCHANSAVQATSNSITRCKGYILYVVFICVVITHKK